MLNYGISLFFFLGGGGWGALSLKTHLGESFPARARRIRRTTEFAGKLLGIKGSRKQRDRYWPPIGHKKQSQTSIRMNRGTGSLRMVSQGLPHPFFKKISRPFLLIQLTVPGYPGMIKIMIFLTNYKIIYVFRSPTDRRRVFTIR